MSAALPSYFATLDDYACVSSAGPLGEAQDKARQRARLFGACHVVERTGVDLRLVETVYPTGPSQLRLPFAWLHAVPVEIPISFGRGPALSVVVPVPAPVQLPLFSRS